MTNLRLLPQVPNNLTAGLPRCGGCTTPLRPAGTSEAQYQGSVPEWGENQCRSCDYISAGKDPEDRFISVDRVAYLDQVREQFEQGRRDRGVPADGLRRTNRLHLQVV